MTPFDEIYADGFPFVWRCLRGLGVPTASLDDAAQDVFVVVYRQLRGFQGRSSLRTWLFGIARNVASNHRRTALRKDARTESLGTDVTSDGADPLQQVQAAQAAHFVQQFLARLGDKKRDVFILAVLEDMPMPEVAAALAIPVNTAYTRLRAARADFQRAVSARLERQNGSAP